MAGAPRRRLMRVGFLGPAGTYSEEALRASAPAGVEEVPVPDRLRGRDGRRRTARSTAPSCRSRTRSRAAVAATLDALACEADRRAHRGRGGPPDPPLPGGGARARRSTRSTRVVSHPQATAQCARFLRERLPHAERVIAPSTADAVLSRARSARAARPRSARASPPSSTAAACSAADVEDHPDNATRFVWLAPAGEAPTRGPRRQDLDRLLGRRRRVAGLARATCCASSRTAA